MLEVCFWEPDHNGKLNRSACLTDSIPGISRFQQVVLHQDRIEAWFLDAMRKWSCRRCQRIKYMVDALSACSGSTTSCILSKRRILLEGGLREQEGKSELIIR
ncbi:hypothetical protein V1504DRAFT_464317 [Lipomyces starkeyi]